MTESYWQREAAWCDRWAGRSIPPTTDFAVLGGGLGGLSTAIALRELQPGADILLLEAERVGSGASGRNAGFLSPLAAPIWLLGADRSSDQAWAANRLDREVHAVARWLSEIVPDAELRPARLSIEGTGRLTDCGLVELARALKVARLDHRVADSRVRPGRRVVAMDGHTVHPYRLVRGLAGHAARAGVRIHERARVRAVDGAPGGARVRVDGGVEVLARRVVVCTNAYTSTVDVGEKVRARAVHSFMIASAPLDPPALRELVRDGDFAVELNTAEAYHRMHGNRVLYGGVDKVIAPADADAVASGRAASRLVESMQKSFPRVGRIAVAEAWAGVFHATATGLPIIRPSASNPAVTLNVGYGGTGVALALVCARLAAAVASGTPFATADDARLYAAIHGTKLPVRAGIRALGRLLRQLTRPSPVT